MTTYSCAIQLIFSAKRFINFHIPTRVITECSIMHYNKSCSLLHCTVFEYDKFRIYFLIKHALSTLNIHY